MSEKLKPCPFCGGEVSAVVLDEEGNVRDEEYERDPYSGLSYAVAHDDPNGACPIATYDAPLPWLYDSRDSVAHVWNRRVGRTCYVDSSHVEQEIGAYSYLEVELSCGHAFTWDDGTPPDYCPYCGAKVIGEETGNAD